MLVYFVKDNGNLVSCKKNGHRNGGRNEPV